MELSYTFFPVVSLSASSRFLGILSKPRTFFTSTRDLHTVTACVVVTNFAVCHEYGLEREANRGLLRHVFSMGVVFMHILAKESQSRKKEQRRRKRTAIVCAKNVRMYIINNSRQEKVKWEIFKQSKGKDKLCVVNQRIIF